MAVVVFVLASMGMFGSAASLSRSVIDRAFERSFFLRLFLLSWLHRVSIGDAIVNGDGWFGSEDTGLDVMMRKKRDFFWLVGVGEGE